MTINNNIKLFLRISLLLCATFFFANATNTVNAQNKVQLRRDRPNILFIFVDDWSYPHAGAYGNKVVKTPTFDRIAKQGILFDHAFVTASSCTPSRSSVLTGQPIHKLEEGGVLASYLPIKFPNYVSLLEKNGYLVGYHGKGWAPGIPEKGGYKRNPAGPKYTISEFVDNIKNSDQPFAFWFAGSHHDVHRPYKAGSGEESGMDIDKVEVPGFLPDVREIRSDILDYYFEIERFDREAGELIDQLDKIGKLKNTLIVYTSDNGMPFPRAKATVYDYGTRMPLAISWAGKMEGGRRTSQFVSFTDFAPTFLEAAGIDIPKEITGTSLIPLLKGKQRDEEHANLLANNPRNQVFIENERHAWVRKENKGYPIRAVRTEDYLYIRNLKSYRWPAGDPQWVATQGPYGDIDSSPTKSYLLENQNDPEIAPYFKLAVGKRPSEELYKISEDPYQLNNLASNPDYEKQLKLLRQKLRNWRWETSDPRFINDDYDQFEKYPYYIPPMRNRESQ